MNSNNFTGLGILGKVINETWKTNNSYAEDLKKRELLIEEKFQEKGYINYFLQAIIQYLKEERMTVNFENAEKVHFALNYTNVTKNIIPKITSFNPKTDKDFEDVKKSLVGYGSKELDIVIGINHYKIEKLDKNIQSVIEEYENNVVPENLIAIKKLIEELENSFIKLIKIDSEFLSDIVEERPLVALMMLTKPKLRTLLLTKFENEIGDYIEAEDIYKKLIPYIKIHIGKTHGQWRHLSDPSKTCIVLMTKNCKIASSKNTQKSYDKSETEGKFLVLQGLSIQADSDNAEVHYLEV